jgi:hypothetical protein
VPVSRLHIALPSDSLKVRPMAMTSPTDFIWMVRVSSVAELLEGEAGDLGDDVVDAGLEGRG